MLLESVDWLSAGSRHGISPGHGWCAYWLSVRLGLHEPEYLFGLEAECFRFRGERCDECVYEALLSIAGNECLGSGAHEHADATALKENLLVNEEVQRFPRRRGVDAHECSELIGRGHLRVFCINSAEDVVCNA